MKTPQTMEHYGAVQYIGSPVNHCNVPFYPTGSYLTNNQPTYCMPKLYTDNVIQGLPQPKYRSLHQLNQYQHPKNTGVSPIQLISNNSKMYYNNVAAKPSYQHQRKRKKKSFLSLFCSTIKGIDVSQAYSYLQGNKDGRSRYSSRNIHESYSKNRPPYIELEDGTRCYMDTGPGGWDIVEPSHTQPRYRDPPDRSRVPEPGIAFRDLFPCFTEILDACSSGKKDHRSRRDLDLQYPNRRRIKPQLETVCLECGHVLEQKKLNREIVNDANLAAYWTSNTAYHDGIENYRVKAIRDDISTFEGYDTWEYDDCYSTGSDNNVDGKIPLPNFHCSQPRRLHARPNPNSLQLHEDMFDTDDGGRVLLPQFKK